MTTKVVEISSWCDERESGQEFQKAQLFRAITNYLKWSLHDDWMVQKGGSGASEALRDVSSVPNLRVAF